MPTSETLRFKSYVKALANIVFYSASVESDRQWQAQIPVLDNDVCLREYSTIIPKVTADQFDDSILCAGYKSGRVDACKGDSGGPLMMEEDYKGTPHFYLIGIVSYSIGCYQIPGIFTSTRHFMDWIIQQIKTM